MTTGPGRMVGLDVARCLALLGMVAVHVLPGDGSAGGLDTLHDVARGRASALFAVLAGVTLALVTGGERPVRRRERVSASIGLVVRALLIALVGLALGHLDSGLAVILTYYGLLFLLGLPFVALGWRPLLALAGLWAALVPVGTYLLRPHLPPFSRELPSFARLDEPGRLLAELAFTGFYPTVPWLAYLLAGMAVGRMPLARRGVAVALAGGGLAVAVVASAVSHRLVDPELARTAEGRRGGLPLGDRGWLLVDAPHTATPFDLALTGGSALAVIGGCLLVVGVTRGRLQRGVAVLFGAGTMTLTLYTLHVVLRIEPLWPPDHGADALRWHWLVLVGIGALFVALGRRGPLEAAVRAISGWVRRPLRA
jgi:hypothetical protein